MIHHCFFHQKVGKEGDKVQYSTLHRPLDLRGSNQTQRYMFHRIIREEIQASAYNLLQLQVEYARSIGPVRFFYVMKNLFFLHETPMHALWLVFFF